MLLAEFIRQGTARLESIYPSPEARGLVLYLCEELLGVKNYTHIVEPSYEIAPEREQELLSCLDRLASWEPIQYVLGYTEFCGRRLRVAPGVLIPRPETEVLVAEALKQAEGRKDGLRMLDLCTGSGCIAWSLALERRDAEVVAVDISDEALALARSQFDTAGPLFVKADLLTDAQNFDQGSFDIIVSNPPYIMKSERQAMRANVLDYEPELALFVPDEDPLLFYRAIAQWCALHLKPDGTGIVEINESLGEQTAAIYRDAGFARVQIIEDFFGKSRFVRFSR